MSDEDLIGYLLDLLDPDDRAAVDAAVAADPDAAARLDAIRLALIPLEADRDADHPPAGLAVRAVARLAGYLVEHEPRAGAGEATSLDVLVRGLAEPASLPHAAPTDHPEPRVVGGRFRADLFVAAGIALVAVGLVFSAVGRVRYQNQMAACQNNLRTLYAGLAGYADTHDDRFPQVGVGSYPTAGSFVAALHDAGQLPAGFDPVCPAAGGPTPGGPVRYTYTLGYAGPNGTVECLRRSAEPGAENDRLPLSSDFPCPAAAPGGGPTSPHVHLHNVLFLGGSVSPTTTGLVGPGGDDIYRNRNGAVAVGTDRTDAVLGRSGDRP